jgi:ribose 5-phosphate isomerase A
VATSNATAALATTNGIPLVELPVDGVDLAVDGADEVDDTFTLIKGGGGAHSRERIVAAAAGSFVVIVDETKNIGPLSGFVPVSLVHFGLEHTAGALRTLAGRCELRRRPDGSVVDDDDGNVLADVYFDGIANAAMTAAALSAVPGLVAHGIFVGMTSHVIVGNADGTIRELVPSA